jgi:cysteine desulfurase / selenocysteine lyase
VQDSLVPRSQYPALAQFVYLNQASLGMMGQPAVTALHGFVEDVGRHGNLFMSDADEVSYFELLRREAAAILGTTERQVAILGSSSELFGQLPYLVPVPADQSVLLLVSDFPAVTRPWLRLQQQVGCTLRFVDDDPRIDLTEALCSAIDSRTAVVAVSHVQYATGRTVDPVRLRAACTGVGARLILDVTQAAGAIPIEASTWRADVVVSSGYKWLGGHGGVAVASVTDDLLGAMPALPGWMGASDPFDFDATRLDLAPDARRFTQATMSYASMAALTVSIQQLLSVGIDAIADHANALAVQLVEGLAGSGWEPYLPTGDPSASGHIVSLAADGRDASAAVRELRDEGIVCGTRGGRIRISLAPYNDGTDVQRLTRILDRR